MNIFITGPPGIGKSSVIKKVIQVLREKRIYAGGMYCPEIRENNKRVGFEIIDILTGNKGILAHIRQSDGPKIGKYKVKLQDLTRIGIHSIDIALEKADFIVIDEIGPMEIQKSNFQKKVIKALDSPKPVLGIIHWKMKNPIINLIRMRKDTVIFELTKENRDSLHECLISKLLRNRIKM